MSTERGTPAPPRAAPRHSHDTHTDCSPHTHPAAAVHHPAVLDRLLQHAERVVQRAVRLVQYVRAGAAQHDGARLAQRHTCGGRCAW
jgi:hypothetical protein